MLDIGEVSRRSGFSVSALRYYEAQGLIASAGRKGLRRMFEPDVLTRLSLISLGQVAGFSLAQIAELIGSAGAPDIARERMAEQADDLDRTIRELSALRDGLRHVLRCSAPSHLQCPRFVRIMRIATARNDARQRRTNGRHFGGTA